MSEKIFIGQRFGSGVILKERKRTKAGISWELLCDCGNIYISHSCRLLSKDCKSCGCGKNPSIIGQRFGLGVVISLNKSENKARYWNLLCDCGNKYVVKTTSLKSKKNKSCGCLKHNPKHGDIKCRIWGEIKGNAKKRKKEFKITQEYAWSIFLNQDKKCAISGIPLFFSETNRQQKINRKGNASLDRIDSSKGYIEGNIQWVDKKINSMKNTYSMQEFIELCSRVYNNNKTT